MSAPTWQTERSVALARARQDGAYRAGYEAGKREIREGIEACKEHKWNGNLYLLYKCEHCGVMVRGETS